MKNVLVTLAPGFEEIETITVVDILRRAGAKVTLGATEEGAIKGSRGVTIVPDGLLEQVEIDEFDMIVLPGGQPGTDNLRDDPRVIEILRQMDAAGKLIAAICAAPIVLQKADLLQNKLTTSHPSVKEKLNGVRYSDERVVIDQNVITSRSPGTAMEFAMKLVEVLFGADRVTTVNNGVMAKL
jgi:4-methyl-5(b-hydroxyethyl)-thiazole monophosphate biosynthesis